MNKRSIWLFIALALLASPAAANACCVWLSSEQSYVVNRSTVALASGRLQRAVFHARTALNMEGVPTDALIAHHNLCIAYLKLGFEKRAQPHCDAALRLAKPRLKLGYRRGAYYIVADDRAQERGLASVAATVLANIRHSTQDKHSAWVKQASEPTNLTRRE